MIEDNQKFARGQLRSSEALLKGAIDDAIRKLRNLKRHLEGKEAHGSFNHFTLPEFSALSYHNSQINSILSYLSVATGDPHEEVMNPPMCHEIKKIDGEWAYLKGGTASERGWYSVDGHRRLRDLFPDE